MVALGDYIGLILSELTLARVRADIESVRVAELYSTNKLLRNFAVPRVRFQNIEISAPVIIDKIDQSTIEASRIPLKISDVRKQVDDSITVNFGKYDIPFQETMGKIKKALDEKSKFIENYLNQPPSPDVPMTDTKYIADEYTKTIDESLKKIKDSTSLQKISIDKLVQDIRSELRIRLSKIRPASPRLQVLVQTSQIKEAGIEAITVLKFRINEDAMEWTQYETTTGDVKDQLVPE